MLSVALIVHVYTITFRYYKAMPPNHQPFINKYRSVNSPVRLTQLPLFVLEADWNGAAGRSGDECCRGYVNGSVEVR